MKRTEQKMAQMSLKFYSISGTNIHFLDTIIHVNKKRIRIILALVLKRFFMEPLKPSRVGRNESKKFMLCFLFVHWLNGFLECPGKLIKYPHKHPEDHA